MLAAEPISRPRRILVVDGSRSSRQRISDVLRDAGFRTREADSREVATGVIAAFEPELVVAEVVLPDASGFDLARQLAGTEKPTAVLFVTERDALADRLAGLEIADDYVTKPFGALELVARVRAVLRRRTPAEPATLRFADLFLSELTREVYRGGSAIELTPTEFSLLRFFMLNPRRVIGKREILESVWGPEQRADSNLVETYVGYLREKLDRAGPRLIHTRRLVGYLLSE